MINPTFASFKNFHIPAKNNENRERSKEVIYKKPQPKTFQELKNLSQANKQFIPSHNRYVHKPLNQVTINQYTPNSTYMKKSSSQANVGVGKSIPGSGAKAKPDLPSKNFVTAKKQGYCHDKNERVYRPMIVGPSLLKNRSFIQKSTKPIEKSIESNVRQPSQGTLTGLYKLVEGNSYDSFQAKSDEINRSQESEDYGRFNSSKILDEDSDLKGSYESCQYKNNNLDQEQNSLNFSRKKSFRDCHEPQEKSYNKEQTRMTICPYQDISSISMIPCELTSSIQSVNSSLQSTNSKQQRPSMGFHKKIQYNRRNREVETKRKISLNDFELIDEIGEGKYGKVYMAQHKQTKFLCALKTVSKAKIKQQDIQEPFIREIKIQMYLNHPHIVKLYGFFADEDNIYLIMECCISGHLLSVMKEKKIFQEPEIVDTISNIFQAVSFIHCHGVIHRDLKPENIVIQNGVYKLCDFGWAAYAKGDTRTTFCGTPLYVCPEILKGEQYDQKADVWGLGVLTYQLAYGRVPFPIWSQSDMVKIVKDPVYFPSWTNVSEKMQNLIKTMLNKDPTRRLSLNEILSNPILSEKTGPRVNIRCEIQLLF